jgi:hypothetical protein
MNQKLDEQLALIREQMPNDIAASICGVQPIDPDVFMNLYKASKSENELREEGYEPVEKQGLSLMWVKKNEPSTD